jgi:pyruvate dehydrogenase E2 component (dihydrolipoamide acetyltransferase)
LTKLIDITLPDLGGAADVSVIEVLINSGDTVDVDTALITLEGDKATMEIPSSHSGVIKEIKVKVGDVVNTGDVIASCYAATVAASDNVASAAKPEDKPAVVAPVQEIMKSVAATAETLLNSPLVYAGPSVRKLAFELGVDLTKISASGAKGRVVIEDLHTYVKNKLSGAGTGAIAPIPAVDFSKFGAVENETLSKIKVLSGKFLSRSWLNVPHVTQHDYVDITDTENMRSRNKQAFLDKGSRLTLLVFVMKSLLEQLQKFPHINASILPDGKTLCVKKYYNIGFAVDTPVGLVVPVIKNIDQKSMLEIATDIVTMSSLAREGKLTPGDMQGGCITISSLGGIGGEFFTPIVNAPEVAIIGLSKASIKPVYIDGEFKPRLMLPVSLSYDHRVIDGAEAAKFIVSLGKSLSEFSSYCSDQSLLNS